MTANDILGTPTPSITTVGEGGSVEKVIWRDDNVWVRESQIPTDDSTGGPYDLTNLKPGKETVLFNAAWMTMEKGKVEKCN
jgi:hypothetical protein